MSDKRKQLSDVEKAQIAEKAKNAGDEVLRKLAEEYGVTEEEIRSWIHETSAAGVTDEDDVSLEATEDFIRSVEYGATFDKLNYKRLTFWSLFGTVSVVLFIIGIMFMHEFNRTSALQERFQQSIFYNIDELQQSDRARLESFGVVDPDAGIYRIPIDSAITILANE
jgi:hypothetical protein